MGSSEALVKKVALNECKKVFIQRDYGQGLAVAFCTGYPDELSGKISKETWSNFITRLNQLYAQAEALSGSSSAESLLSFITCNLSRLCVRSIWEKKLEEVGDYLEEMNQSTFIKRGVFVSDPIEKGLRVAEMALLDESVPVPQTQNHTTAPAVNQQLQPR